MIKSYESYHRPQKVIEIEVKIQFEMTQLQVVAENMYKIAFRKFVTLQQLPA